MNAHDEDGERQAFEMHLCVEQSVEAASVLQPLFTDMRPAQIVAVLADVAAGIAQSTGMDEVGFQCVLQEVLRSRFDRGWVFERPPGVEPS